MSARAFWSKRSRALIVAGCALLWVSSLLQVQDALEEPSAWNLTGLALNTTLALILSWAAWARFRPVLELRGTRLHLGVAATFPPRVVDLGEVAAIEPEGGFYGRFYDVVRVRLRSGRSFRLFFSDLHDDERPVLRALLADAAAGRLPPTP
jgi:hypothetical protein